jgi:hypothetical protein
MERSLVALRTELRNAKPSASGRRRGVAGERQGVQE